jgi:hypothetical protein
MNKHNTYGNAMWTPEMERAMQERMANNELNDLEEI